jgi:arginyl-tRNA synthetase
MENPDPMGVCLEEVRTSLKGVLGELGIGEIEIKLETPPENLGDISFSCFSLAKELKNSPNEIAKEIAEKLTPMENIAKWENVGPYVNFHLNVKKLAEMTLKMVLEMKDDYGNSSNQDKKIILEHTSANPTDKLHIGRARNPIIGDSLARMLRKAGYDVETQYYVDDMGKQAVTLALGVEIWDTKPESDDSIGPYQYASKMALESSDIAAKRDDWLQKLEGGDPEISDKVQKACAKVMDKEIISSLGRINVLVDRYVNESRFVSDGSVDKVIATLKQSQFCSNEEGSFFIDLEQFYNGEKEGKFIFTRSDGTSLYATRDIAYHLWKFENCDFAVNILGEDHKLESEQVKIGLEILGSENFPEVIFYSFVSLPEGRMSTRKGKVVFLDDLIDEAFERAELEVKSRRDDLSQEKMRDIAEKVGIGAIRYNILRVQPEKKIVFKWEDALNFEGNSAPFIQYSHARACSILRKAEEEGIEKSDDYDASLLQHPSEISLIKEMARFPEKVREYAEKRRPHGMTGYAYNLASLFNQFYRDCPVLACEDESLRRARLTLVDVARIVLNNSLFCLGIEAPEEM